MSTSQFCIQQRQKEQQQLKRLLIFGFTGSAVLHGILAYTLPHWSFESPKQAEKPMEVIIVEKPQPKPKPKPKPKPEPEVKSKPIVEPKPKPKPEPEVKSKPIVEPKPKPKPEPEPVKAQTPPPPVKTPEPVKAQTPPPKPAPKPAPIPAPTPKKVLTTPSPAPSQPIVSAPAENIERSPSLSNSVTTANSSVTSTESSDSNSNVSDSAVATNSTPPRPESNREVEETISCVSNCEPEYPAALEGVEGRAGVKLTIDSNGNVIGAELTDADSNSQVNRQALLAARQMEFSSPSDEAASVQVKIDFTVEGSEYDRARREERERREQAERERQEQEAAARQQQLEAEKQARQEQLERERQARQQQLEQPQQESAPLPPAADTQPAPKPLPALSEQELDEERLRKFRERMEKYQQE